MPVAGSAAGLPDARAPLLASAQKLGWLPRLLAAEKAKTKKIEDNESWSATEEPGDCFLRLSAYRHVDFIWKHVLMLI